MFEYFRQSKLENENITLLIKKMPRKMSLPTFINLLQVDNINDFSSDEFIMNPGANI